MSQYPSCSKAMNVIPGGMEDDQEDDNDWYMCTNIRKTNENLKIKIIPDVTENAGLNGQKFNSELDTNVQEWFEQLRQIWSIYKKSPTIVQTLQSFFAVCSNPFLDSLKLFVNCSDFENSKTSSLAYTIMEELHKFKTSANLDTGCYIDDNLKMVAFNFVKRQGLASLFKLVASSFELISSKHLFVDKIRELISQHQYKEACQIAYELEIFNEFSYFEFIFPLILQDKISIAEEFLSKAVHLQRPFIEFLDSLLDKSEPIGSKCDHYICKYNYDGVKCVRLQAKTLNKLISRLARNYKLPKDATPNVHKMKSFGALKFLIHKNYVDRCLNRDSWEEMVKETVGRDFPELQLELIETCTFYGDYAEAKKWKEYFHLPFEKMPNNLREYLNQKNSKEAIAPRQSSSKNWDDDDDRGLYVDDVHKLSLSESDIVLVDNNLFFQNMLADIVIQQIVAFDSEWKPTFSINNEVALIQLATRTQIYLIDVITLGMDYGAWDDLGKCLFNNNEILKIGFAPGTDLSMLQKIIPSLNLSLVSQSSKSYLDLQELWRKLNKFANFTFPYDGDSTNENLSNLVKLCFGKKLDKTNQFSNWEKRPLRKEQLIYAALDAFCLLEIYDVIECRLTNIDVDFNELITNFLMEKKTKLVKKKTTNSIKKCRDDYDNTNGPSAIPYWHGVSVSQICFVCDTMLEGLAKGLRRCGIDTILLSSKTQYEEFIRLATNDKRVILSRGNAFYRFCQYVPDGFCFRVTSDNIDDQLKEILEFYRITVTKADIFSRCQICNCGEFISVTPREMNEMRGQLHVEDNNCCGLPQEPRPKSWKLKSLSEETKRNGITSSGAVIQFELLPEVLGNNVQAFFICNDCGKCYWDGSHLENILKGTMKDILTGKNSADEASK